MRSKSTLIAFLGLKELVRKFGLRTLTSRFSEWHRKPTRGGKSDNFAITTDDQWKLELPSLLDGTGSEMKSMYSIAFVLCARNPEILLGTATCFEYSRSYFHAIYDVTAM